MAVPFRLAFAAVVFALPGWRADEPAKPAPPTRSLDAAKLPPNAIIIVSDSPRDALQNVDAVVLTPDEYKKLLEAAAEAKRLANPDKPEPPSVCRLSGKIETRGTQEVAILRAEFQFRTTIPRATVLLGLQKGKPLAATIDDGKLGTLVPLREDEGFAVFVDAAGEHRVAVDLEAPVISRGPKGGEHVVDLGLPGAAITAIERLALPAGVARARVGGRSYPVARFGAGTPAAPAFLLGPAPKLDLAWDASTAAARVEPQTIVEGRYDVRVEDRIIVLRARLTMKVQVGTVATWEVQAPPTAELTIDPAPADNAIQIQKPQAKGKPWIIRRDPSAADLILDLTLRTEFEPGRRVAVPSFVVVGAQQRGMITVAAPPQLRLAYESAAGVSRRESTDEAGHEAVFTFYQLPASGPPLSIVAQPARGDVETRVVHQFTLAERGWRWQGKVDVRPVRAEVTSLDLEVPNELQELRPASAELIEGIAPLRDLRPGWKLFRVQLAEARRKAFTIMLDGIFPISASVSAAALPLPRPLGTIDRGGQIAASVPAGLDLRGTFRDWEGDKPGVWDHALDPAPRGAAGLATAVERTPARVDLAWRAPRTDVAVAATADIQLGERQATVRHLWHVPAGAASPRQFIARGPAILTGRLRAIDGATVTSTVPGEWTVQVTAPAGRDAVFALAYSFPLPTGPERATVSIPLVWLEPCPRCETDVHVWSAAVPNGLLVPASSEGPWTEVPLTAVSDRPTLPALALHGSGPHLPLNLRLTEAPVGPGTGLVVDRLWVEVAADSDGRQLYRTHCLVRPQQTHYVDVELPAPPLSILFVAQVDGKQVPWTAIDGVPGASSQGGRFIRVRLDPVENGRGALVLDLIYMLPVAVGSHWQMTMIPPRLRGPVFTGTARWHIGSASNDLLVAADDSMAFDWRWGWQGILFGPRPAWTGNDIARWFGGDVRTSDLSEGWVPVWVGWQSAADPVQFIVVPRPLALLIASLAVLVVGFGAVRVGLVWRMIGVVTAAIGLAVAAIVRPQGLALFLYAAEPGALVLVLAMLANWAVRRRYRRRVLFLPALTRAGDPQVQLTAGPPLTQNGPAHRVRREPTTVDAPAPQAGLPGGEW